MLHHDPSDCLRQVRGLFLHLGGATDRVVGETEGRVVTFSFNVCNTAMS